MCACVRAPTWGEEGDSLKTMQQAVNYENIENLHFALLFPHVFVFLWGFLEGGHSPPAFLYFSF